MSMAADILRWANAHKLGQLLFALAELDVWKLLAAGPAAASELAATAHLEPCRLASTLGLLHRFGLLNRDEAGRYSLPPSAKGMEPLLRLEASLQRTLISSHGVQTWLRGSPAADPLDRDPSEEEVALFLGGIEAGCEAVALHLWRLARLEDRRRLLDLGGGAGAHAAVLCRHSPALSVTIVDREIMRPAFTRRAAQSASADRLSFVAANLREPESFRHLVPLHDALLVSNLLHLLPPYDRERFADVLGSEMAPGTRLIIHDLFLDCADGEIAGLMSVDWMLLGAEFSVTMADCAAWLEKRGLRVTAVRSLPGLPSGVIVAEPAKEA
jgi:hypothetical protein